MLNHQKVGFSDQAVILVPAWKPLESGSSGGLLIPTNIKTILFLEQLRDCAYRTSGALFIAVEIPAQDPYAFTAMA